VVAGDYYHRDTGCVESFQCFQDCRVGPGLRFYRVEEVARVDEDTGFLLYDLINRFEEVVVHLLFPKVHPGPGIEAGECCEAQVGIGDMDEFHRVFLTWNFKEYKREGNGVKMSREVL